MAAGKTTTSARSAGSLRGALLAWGGILIGTLTLFANVAPLFPLSDWARLLIALAHHERTVWDWLIGWTGARVHPSIASALSFSVSQFLAAAGSLLQLSKLAVEHRVGPRSFLYGNYVPDREAQHRDRMLFVAQTRGAYAFAHAIFIPLSAYAASAHPLLGAGFAAALAVAAVLGASAVLVLRWIRRMAYMLVLGVGPGAFREARVDMPDLAKYETGEADYWFAVILYAHVGRLMTTLFAAGALVAGNAVSVMLL